MSNIDREIEARITTFVHELNSLIRQAALEAVSGALGGVAATPARRGPGRPPKTSGATASRGGRSSAGGKRAPELLARTVENLHKHIAAHPGERIEQIGKHMKLSTKDLALPIQKLLAAKKISKKGVKRSTTYFPAKS